VASSGIAGSDAPCAGLDVQGVSWPELFAVSGVMATRFASRDFGGYPNEHGVLPRCLFFLEAPAFANWNRHKAYMSFQ
jgi:hypothetical protein